MAEHIFEGKSRNLDFNAALHFLEHMPRLNYRCFLGDLGLSFAVGPTARLGKMGLRDAEGSMGGA